MKGYDTGVVDAHEHCDAAHDTRPLPLELMGFPEVAVDTGVQQADDSWNRQPLCVRSRLSLWLTQDHFHFCINEPSL